VHWCLSTNVSVHVKDCASVVFSKHFVCIKGLAVSACAAAPQLLLSYCLQKLRRDGKLNRPSYGELVLMMAEARQLVNKRVSRRKDKTTGEEILTSVVRRSWEMSGWIRGKPYSYKLQKIMEKDFKDVKLENAISRVYRRTWMKEEGPQPFLRKVSVIPV